VVAVRGADGAVVRVLEADRDGVAALGVLPAGTYDFVVSQPKRAIVRVVDVSGRRIDLVMVRNGADEERRMGYLRERPPGLTGTRLAAGAAALRASLARCPDLPVEVRESATTALDFADEVMAQDDRDLPADVLSFIDALQAEVDTWAAEHGQSCAEPAESAPPVPEGAAIVHPRGAR
jgi:hypothetical protein